MPSVNIDNETAGAQAGKCSAYAALKFIARGSRSDDLAYRERNELGHPNRRSEREGSTTAAEHGVEIERHLNADHVGSDFP